MPLYGKPEKMISLSFRSTNHFRVKATKDETGKDIDSD